jgi:methionyl-tRNA formyltransferase
MSQANQIKVLFMGTSQLAEPVLTALLKNNYQLIGVLTKAEKKKIPPQYSKNPIVQIATENKIPLFQPEKLNSQFIQEIKNLQPDLIIVISYGKIIPEEILNVPKFGALNVHVSLLPKLRGASPVQNAILQGWRETGVSIIKMDSGMDSGDILIQEKIEIGEDETLAELSERIFPLGAKTLIKILPDWLAGKLIAKKQDHSQATFCQILTRDDGRIDWNDEAEKIYNQFRAFSPWPGVFTFWQKKVDQNLRLKLTELKLIHDLELIKKLNKVSHSFFQNSELKNEKNEIPNGLVFQVEKKVFITTQNGFLEIIKLQLEGKAEMEVKNFINGNQTFIKSILK